jgi:hypothetical protein
MISSPKSAAESDRPESSIAIGGELLVGAKYSKPTLAARNEGGYVIGFWMGYA